MVKVIYINFRFCEMTLLFDLKGVRIMAEREILFRGKLKDKDEWIGEWIE